MSINFDIEPKQLINGDEFLINQALFNVLENAIDFSPKGSEIKVELLSVGKNVEVIISDEGPGVPEFAIDKIFNKFFSLARPNSNKKSTGLGLSFVKEVCRIHEAQIKVENKNSIKTGLCVTLLFSK